VKTFIKLPAVMTASGLKRTAIFNGAKHRTFPRPFRIGIKGIVWDAEEIAGWQAEKLAHRDDPLVSRNRGPYKKKLKTSNSAASE